MQDREHMLLLDRLSAHCKSKQIGVQMICMTTSLVGHPGIDIVDWNEAPESLLARIVAKSTCSTIKHIKLCVWTAYATTNNPADKQLIRARLMFQTSPNADGICECCKPGFEELPYKR